MRFIVGFIIVGGSVLGGFTGMGGHLWVLWQPFEILIILGAAIGSYVVANPMSVLRDTTVTIGSLLKGRRAGRTEYLELISLIYLILRAAKSKGMNSLEKEIDNPRESQIFSQFPSVLRHERSLRFLCDYLRLMSLGLERPHEVESLMDEEIVTLSRELNQVPKALAGMADGLPALGIVAAVLGVIKAMGAISQPPEVLGQMIGGALIGTFLGVLMSYGFVGPIAGAARQRREAELNRYICVKVGLIAYLNGCAPQICAEHARKVLFADVQPSFDEVEGATSMASLGKSRADRQAA
ncbi:flagellar motor stator protein MotA [Arenibaculum pallidiluteum]|uniref:flagellar motor stator protein MotA n=1 Tax=Arenibaculum pallidiluteum TaxID=2812559 RepID=UPI001A96F7B3|nr:flagellar motor stator protein MotA [Arenibaculum pallidiluteum]